MAETWDPYPHDARVNDLGHVGLIQTPTSRFAPDGQVFVGGNKVGSVYERYFVTLQATDWLEGTLRYSSVGNRLFSDVPDFSGDQSFKDRGVDLKLKLLGERRYLPSVSIGARDFLGTGIFAAEYVVANKYLGPFDISVGLGFGNLGTRDDFGNPITSSPRRPITGLGGSTNSNYFKGPVAIFGGVQYQSPIKGLTLQAELEGNDYQSEALGNVFPVKSRVNVGANYAVAPWLHVGAAWERGNRLGLRLSLSTNVNRRARTPKFDPPPDPIRPDGPTKPIAATADKLADGWALNATPEQVALTSAVGLQGAALYSADFKADSVDLYVAQTRFRNMATGIGRIARAAFSVLPAQYERVTVVLVESGLEVSAVTLSRADLAAAVNGGPHAEEPLLKQAVFSPAPGNIEGASFQGPGNTAPPRFVYAIRPGLRTTLGRPEQFILYQVRLRFHGTLIHDRGWFSSGSVGVNVVDNFDQIRIGSDSLLPRVRSDLDKYLREGKYAITHLQTDYSFKIAPELYGHVYGGLLEEMFAGVGGEILYRPFDRAWAIGADLNFVQQRGYEQLFGFRDYNVATGHVTGYYHFDDANIDLRVKAGRYLAKDVGATFEIARTFASGVTFGAFATFTDVSAAEFGEGRFDKGVYFSMPLDLVFFRNVRSSVGIAFRPLIRDGGQTLLIRRPLYFATQAATPDAIRYDWDGISD